MFTEAVICQQKKGYLKDILCAKEPNNNPAMTAVKKNLCIAGILKRIRVKLRDTKSIVLTGMHH